MELNLLTQAQSSTPTEQQTSAECIRIDRRSSAVRFIERSGERPPAALQTSESMTNDFHDNPVHIKLLCMVTLNGKAEKKLRVSFFGKQPLDEKSSTTAKCNKMLLSAEK